MTKATVLLLVFWLALPQARAACPPLTIDRIDRKSVLDDGHGTLWITNTLILGVVADEIAKRLANSTIDQVVFDCVRGGLTKEREKLEPLFQNVAVVVKGVCNSACAHLALAAKKLALQATLPPETPTSIMIHASYFPTTGTPTDAGLKNLDFYSKRLAAIPRETLATALSEERKGNFGIFIAERKGEAFSSSKYIAYHCTPYPESCTTIEGTTLNALDIEIVENIT